MQNPVPTILLHPTSPTSPTSAEGSPFWQTADSNSNNNSSASSESSDQFPTYNSSFSPMNYYTAGAESTSDYRTHRNSLAYDGIVSLRNNLSPPPTNKVSYSWFLGFTVCPSCYVRGPNTTIPNKTWDLKLNVSSRNAKRLIIPLMSESLLFASLISLSVLQ